MYIKNKEVYGYFDEDRYHEDNWCWEKMICRGDGPYYFNCLEEVKKDLKTINTLIESDFSKINDKDFYYLISRIYSVDWTIKDLLNIISRVNNVYYDKIELLNTRQTYEISKQYGHGKDLDCYTDKFQIRWIVATIDNFNLNLNYNYSYDEIENMLLNKQIVAISVFPKKLSNDDIILLDNEEDFKDINELKIGCDSNYITGKLYSYNFNNPGYFDKFYNNLGINFDCLNEGDNVFSKNVYKEASSMLRIRLNKEQVSKDCEQIVLFLKSEANRLSSLIQKSYFDVYSDKDKCLDLLKEITDINNTLLLKFENTIDNQESVKVLRRKYL